MLKNVNIGVKLILIGVIILLLPITAIGIIATREASQGLRELEHEQLEKRTSEIALSIYNVLAAEKRIAVDIAERRETKAALMGQREGGGDAGSDYAINAILTAFVAKEGLGYNYQGINIIDRRGFVIASSSANRIGLDLAEREYVKKALQGQVFIGQPAISKATGEPFFALAAPVYDGAEQIIGVAAIVVDLEFIWPIIKDSTIGETGYAYVTDAEALVIAHPDTSIVFETNMQNLDGMEQITRRFLNGESGYQNYIYKGVPKTAGFAVVPETGWGVFLTITNSEYMAPAYAVRNVVIIVAGIGFLIALVIFILFSRTLTSPIRKGVQFAIEISQGKLYTDIAVSQRDEIGILADALKGMKEKLLDVVGNVNDASVQVTDGSNQLAESAEQLSQGATEQAANAEEVSSSVEEMSANIQQNTDNAAQTEAISSQAAQDAEEGGTAVLEAVRSMNEIAEKINVVAEIARQTNMLSLNAAIEAARAGEHGKGFAVVAAEVGKLAAVSQQASNEILELATQSVNKANNAGEKIKAIVPNIKKTADLVYEISASSREQNSGASQINEAMQQLDQVIQQNAASAEEASSMSEELTAQAQQLRDLMSFFKMVNSDAQGPGRSSRTREAVKRTAKPEQTRPSQSGGADKRPRQAKLTAPKNGKDTLDDEFVEF